MPSREAEGQHSFDKFNSVGRNSLNLDIFSPVTDGSAYLFFYKDALVYICTITSFLESFPLKVIFCMYFCTWIKSLFFPSLY